MARILFLGAVGFIYIAELRAQEKIEVLRETQHKCRVDGREHDDAASSRMRLGPVRPVGSGEGPLWIVLSIRIPTKRGPPHKKQAPLCRSRALYHACRIIVAWRTSLIRSFIDGIRGLSDVHDPSHVSRHSFSVED